MIRVRRPHLTAACVTSWGYRHPYPTIRTRQVPGANVGHSESSTEVLTYLHGTVSLGRGTGAPNSILTPRRAPARYRAQISDRLFTKSDVSFYAEM
jgi:hypothetical protein